MELKAQLITSNEVPHFRLTGFTGKGSIIQSSADLETWLPISTNNAPDGQLAPLDFNAANIPTILPRRFWISRRLMPSVLFQRSSHASISRAVRHKLATKHRRLDTLTPV